MLPGCSFHSLSNPVANPTSPPRFLPSFRKASCRLEWHRGRKTVGWERHRGEKQRFPNWGKRETECVQNLCMFLLWQDLCVLLQCWFSRDSSYGRNVTSKEKKRVTFASLLFDFSLMLVKSLVYKDHEGLCDAVEEQNGTRSNWPNDSVSLVCQQTSEQSPTGVLFWVVYDGLKNIRTSAVAILFPILLAHLFCKLCVCVRLEHDVCLITPR